MVLVGEAGFFTERTLVMNRINLSGSWFDMDKAKVWEESTRFDGNNYISVATGSQWDHEELIRTRKGKLILHSWSQWQGSGEEYQEITIAEAVDWMVRHGHDPDVLTPGALAEAEV
jgi:hypothetical protein